MHQTQAIKRLRVLIAEDNEDVRAILVALLSSEFEVVGAVGDGEQLVRSAMVLQPDLIISDISMPQRDGFAAKTELQARCFERPFVFVSIMDYEGFDPPAEESPVGYVHKIDIFTELKLAIRTVAVGNSYISRSFKKRQ